MSQPNLMYLIKLLMLSHDDDKYDDKDDDNDDNNDHDDEYNLSCS